MFIYHNDRLAVKCDRCKCIVFDYPTAGFVEAYKGKEFICVGCREREAFKAFEVTDKERLDVVRQRNKEHYQKNKEYIKFKTKMRRANMKNLILSFLLTLLLTTIVQAQTQVQVKYYPSSVRMSWDIDTTGDVSEYYLFYVQGEDTNTIKSVSGMIDNASYDDVWGWRFGSTIYTHYNLEIRPFPLPVTHYWVRVGIIAVGYNGQKSPLKVSRFIRIRNIAMPKKLELD